MNKITIGYFSPDSFPAGTSENSQYVKFLEELKTNPQVKITQYKGFSSCRCCGKMNGSQELSIKLDNEYIIPEGYIHYLRDHNLEVDSNLLKLMAILKQ